MPAGLGPDPLLEEGAVPQLVPVGDLGGELGLAGVEAEQGGHAGDHVGGAEGGGGDVGAVVLDLAVGDAALLGADPGLDELAEERGDLVAGGAPRGGPEGEEGPARGGRELEVGGELVLVADAVRGEEERGFLVLERAGNRGKQGWQDHGR